MVAHFLNVGKIHTDSKAWSVNKTIIKLYLDVDALCEVPKSDSAIC